MNGAAAMWDRVKFRSSPSPATAAPGVPGLDLAYLDYEALAVGYGVPAVRAGRPDELADALKTAFAASDGPRLILVNVTPGVQLGG